MSILLLSYVTTGTNIWIVVLVRVPLSVGQLATVASTATLTLGRSTHGGYKD